MFIIVEFLKVKMSDNLKYFQAKFQKQPFRSIPRKRCSVDMQHIYTRTPMPKCDFNKFVLRSAWGLLLTCYKLFEHLFLSTSGGLLKKRLQHRCFAVKFAKFWRTPFIAEHFWWLLLHSQINNILVFNPLSTNGVYTRHGTEALRNFEIYTRLGYV